MLTGLSKRFSYVCVLPLKLLFHNWILMQNANEVQYAIQGKTESSLTLCATKFENLWLENKENIRQSGTELYCRSFLKPVPTQCSQQPPHSFWCTLYYQIKLGPICFYPSLSHHPLYSLAKHPCAYWPCLWHDWGAQSLISIPASGVISRREGESTTVLNMRKTHSQYQWVCKQQDLEGTYKYPSPYLSGKMCDFEAREPLSWKWT